jgi:hypothetical protein
MRLTTSAAHAAEQQMAYADWIIRNTRWVVRDRAAFMDLYINNGKRPALPPDEILRLGALLVQGEHDTAVVGTPVFVTADAHDIIDEASSMLPDGEMLLARERDSQPLMLWFERPYQYGLIAAIDEENFVEEQWSINAISIDPMDDMRRPGGDHGPGVAVMLYGRPAHVTPAERTESGGMIPVDMIALMCDVGWEATEHPEWILAMKKWIVAMYRLMGDHIEREVVQVDRAARRRLERAGFPPEGYVSELRLRKVVYGSHGDGDGPCGPLRFRHRVDGHWRNFYCPSMGKPVGDPGAYRYKYVNDYVRGPKSAPLIDSTKVVTLAR